MGNSELLGSQALKNNTFHHNDLSQTWGGLDWAYSQEHQKIFHVEGIHFAITTKKHKKHKVFMTPCSRGHIQTFIHYSVMPNAPITFPHPVHLCDCSG